MVMTGIAWPGQLLKSFETLPVSSQGFPDNQEFITRTNASILEIKSPCKIAHMLYFSEYILQLYHCYCTDTKCYLFLFIAAQQM